MIKVFLAFGLPLIFMAAVYLFWQGRQTREATQKLEEARQGGLTEPASLHPVIDPNICLGCATCVTACPEGEILGLVKRKAVLVSPSSCIGHGACREACPTNAITLVFGTATRGVEIPLLSPDFETSVPGIYIAGELGGMGLIKNAIAQGQQAVAAIARRRRPPGPDYDLVIVGAGPAGLGAALAAKEKGLKYIVLEQDSIGGTVSHYPRGKIVMTQPAVLPVVGKFQFREASKESLVDFWQSVVHKTGLSIQTCQQVEEVETLADGGFCVVTGKGRFTAASVLLTMGRRGTPRKLDVPGEELPKVVYRLIDPEQYTGQKVIVVGGGDSALEAALAVAEQSGSQTVLSYRGAAFSRAKAKNRERVEAATRTGRLEVLLESGITKITPRSVTLETASGERELANDIVIVCAGGILPTPFLKKIGIHVEEKFGTS